jgi:acyl carrier protein
LAVQLLRSYIEQAKEIIDVDFLSMIVIYIKNYTGKRTGMDSLIFELKKKIIETLNLIDVAPDDIDAEAQLIGGDLGLDSIDVLELVMMLEKDYGVEIDSKELGVKVFASVCALAAYVYDHKSTIKAA